MQLCFLAVAVLPLAALAQQTKRLFIDRQPNQQWAASVVGQDDCGTTLEIVCTAGSASLPNGYGVVSCNPTGFESDFATASVIYSGTSVYEAYQSYAIARNGGIEVQARETCSLYGTTKAICTLTASGSTAGQETIVTTVTTSSGRMVADKFRQVAITDGTLTTPTAKCSSPAPFTSPPTPAPSSAVVAASSSLKSASGGTRDIKLEVRKVIVIPAAAVALLARLA